jgi:glycosyltransferase involved in cell wall biosynthesis
MRQRGQTRCPPFNRLPAAAGICFAVGVLKASAMHIVYVTETYPPEVNGAALTAARAVGYLRACGHEVELVRPRRPGEKASAASHREWLTAACPIPMYPTLRFGWASAASMRERWRRRVPDLVHVAAPGPLGAAALRAAKAEGIACTADFRTNFHAYCHHYGLGWAYRWVIGYLRRVHANADVTFVPTRSARDQLRSYGFGNLDVVGRGVDAHRFSPAWRSDGVRAAWGAGAKDPVFLYVGRVAAEKNVKLALATFVQLRTRYPRARMVVVGDGPERAELQKKFPDVVFAGTQRGDNLARIYASADVFLFPSLTETFGNVTLEAMASGLLVVAYNLAAAAEHVQDGVNGCLARAPSPVGFAVAALRALAHAQPDSSLRRRARVAALAIDWSSVLSAFERRLADVAAARMVPHGALA